MQLSFAAMDQTPLAEAALAVLSLEEAQLTPEAKSLDEAFLGVLSRAIKGSRFTGAKGQTLDILAPHPDGPRRLVLVGTGVKELKDLEEAAVEQAAAVAIKSLLTSGIETLVLRLGDLSPNLGAKAGLGARLASYRFDRYRTTEKPESRPSLVKVVIESKDPESTRKAFAEEEALADAITFTRNLVSEPANVLYPEEFAKRVLALTSLGLEIEVLGESEMQAKGFGALLGVGRGSRKESKLVIIQWRGASDTSAKPVAFVGKGVTFDSGGISIKPAENMEDMKWDMAGAGTVAGLMHLLAARKAQVNAVGILGLVENMPDGDAQRPGDVVTSLSGQTIEVINTDAEGRLVLADALWYCQERFQPQFMIDLATLTGAIIIALGHDYAGLFSNNDEISDRLIAAGKTTGDLVWRLPIPDSYEKQIESQIADVKNVGGRAGGSITAALFLQRFVNKYPWVHLDIASVAWKKPSQVATIPEGASGFGVRLLNRLIADHYEG